MPHWNMRMPDESVGAQVAMDILDNMEGPQNIE